jgi:Xaa-Pro aminopeptidase
MATMGKPAMPYGWGRVPYTLEHRLPYMNLPFDVSEYHTRTARLQQKMAAAGVDAAVVLGNRSDMSNVRYLSNFEDFYGGETFVFVPGTGEPSLTTNAIMHGEPMHSGIQDAWLRDVRCAAAPRTVTGSASPATIYDHLEDFVNEHRCARGRIGVCGDFARDLVEFLAKTFPNVEVVPVQNLLAEMRTIKSAAEVEVMRTAASLADAAMKAALDAARPGVSEFDLAAEAAHAMYKGGAEHVGFAMSVVTGKRCGFKHMAPTANKVQAGDMVYIDCGARYMGYYSDCSRQRVCGEPTAEQSRFIETQIEIVQSVTRAARPGSVIGELAEIGIAVARQAGYEDHLYFRGHGIGCHTHDRPSFTPGNPARLEENMVFCFEPMLVKTEFGTACWEDMWHVTSTGVESLNRCQIRW